MRYTDKAVLQIILIFVEANEDLFFWKEICGHLLQSCSQGFSLQPNTTEVWKFL